MHLFELPIEIINRIFDFCTYGVLHKVSQTSKLMYKIYVKYDEYYEKLKSDNSNFDDVISYIKMVEKFIIREKKIKNKNYIFKVQSQIKLYNNDDDTSLLYRRLIRSILKYICIIYDIKCYKCNVNFYSNVRVYDDFHLLFCIKCMVYRCNECSTDIHYKYPYCRLCMNDINLI